MTVGLYAGSQRSSSTAAGRETRHSFSFGPHYDPANLGFGPLVCHNDDLLDPPCRRRLPRPPALRARDRHLGARGCARAHRLDGCAARGRGRARAGAVGGHGHPAQRGRRPRVGALPLRPGVARADPRRRRAGVRPGRGARRRAPGWSRWSADRACPSASTGARLLVARLDAGQSVTLPDDPRQHVFAAIRSGLGRRRGPARPVTPPGSPTSPVTSSRASEPTELLVWSFATRRAASAWRSTVPLDH